MGATETRQMFLVPKSISFSFENYSQIALKEHSLGSHEKEKHKLSKNLAIFEIPAIELLHNISVS